VTSGQPPRRTPRLLAISDRHALAAGPAVHAGGPTVGSEAIEHGGRNADPAAVLEPWLLRLAAAGVDAVQLREKDLDDADLYALAHRARALLPPSIALLINGRPDVALAAAADGVHLPAAGLPAEAVRRRWGGRLTIGVSTHAPEEVEAARRAGADYVVFGPVYPTPSKARCGPPAGLDGLRRAAAAGLPVLALGGVGADRLAELAAAGASGAAGIRCFLDGESVEAMVRAAAQVFAGDPLDSVSRRA
jgi:thiamine-phosphate pyrophosphorylase